MSRKYFLLILVGTQIFTFCSRKKTELVWKSDFYKIGSQSSPRTADLNADGVLDIVFGAAQNENQHTEQGILAINGLSGEVMWQQEADDQVFGSATLLDITADGIPEVFIGGRSSVFKALNGATGEPIWEYHYQFENDSSLQYARFNFYNSVLVPDQNKNGLADILTVNGGNVKAKPYSEDDRFPGTLMLFDSSTGNILAADTMPDGKESYMSPVCYSQRGGKDETMVIFGTGGETVSGRLYLANLSDLVNGNLSGAKIIASEEGHGFIAPPVVADITEDGYYDIIAISHGGTMFAIDGKSHQQLWKTSVKNTETSSGIAVGYFTNDHVPDFFTVLSKGTWPKSTIAIQIMVNGKNGQIAFQDSLGCVGFWSPVACDLNNDGIDEGMVSYSDYNCYRDSTDLSPLEIEHKVIAIDFSTGSRYNIDATRNFKNVFVTPWLGDLDHDSYLDIVYSQCYSPNTDLLSFLGMTVKRISTHIRIRKPPSWGAYMGNDGDGIFKE